jgi:hypothetical protein
MAPKSKTKTVEPSLRDKLSASFMKAFQNDFELYGVEVIEQLRERHPDKYAQIATQLIATVEPKAADGFEQCDSMEDIGRRLWKSVGVEEDAATDDMVARAIAANDRLIDELGQIAQEAMQ